MDDISRRTFAAGIGAALAASSATAQRPAAARAADVTPARQAGDRLQIGMLLFPGLTPLDLVGPQPYFAALPNADVHLLWKDKQPVASAHGYSLVPTTAIRDCPRDLDVLFVPGGAAGTRDMLEDDDILDFVADRGRRARYVTSVCTGSLILGAAGLLTGYRATSHWRFRDLLTTFGATPVEQRIVTDRNRVTGGGVTAGIDFGLVIAAQISGRERAEAMQLATEYDPDPPFAAGSPRKAPPAVRTLVDTALAPAYQEVKIAGEHARHRRHLG